MSENENERYQVVLYSISGTPFGSALVSKCTAETWAKVIAEEKTDFPSIPCINSDTGLPLYLQRGLFPKIGVHKAIENVTFPKWTSPYGMGECENLDKCHTPEGACELAPPVRAAKVLHVNFQHRVVGLS